MKPARTMSARGLNWLKSFEDCKLSAYKDSAGVWTIGYGHTAGVQSGMKITQEQADQFFADDVKNIAEKYVNALPAHIYLTQNQFDALCFLVFNTGPSAIAAGTTIRNALAVGNYGKAAEGFLLWVKVRDQKTGKLMFCQGLYNRRKREMAYFQGRYDQVKEELDKLHD